VLILKSDCFVFKGAGSEFWGKFSFAGQSGEKRIVCCFLARIICSFVERNVLQHVTIWIVRELFVKSLLD
jgi:hypothetical protein